ncbi:MAG: hypothetical protein MUC50_04640 [Myxococcota bacterium]|jgi:exopolyphosphatase/guanosine-5'-triphosphate,3'-diphosphate pyrophosphatase|nr:hypothetical protein [Myxococcota bacterium]
MKLLPSGLVAQGLDLGSNTFSFCELSTDECGALGLRHDASIPVRLSEGLSPGGRLRPAAIARGLAVLESYKERWGFRKARLRAVGTAVLRMCAHPEDFTGPASELIGVPVEILSGEQEAQLTFRGAALGLPALPEQRWLMVDIGGQSTEIGWREESRLVSYSLPMGVVSLSEAYLHGDPPSVDHIRALRAAVKTELERAVPCELPGDLMCVAGTATTLGALALELTHWDRGRLHGLRLSLAELQLWSRRVLEVDSKKRTELYGISEGRSDVFPAGLALLEEVLCHLNKNSFTISACGLRVGVALSVLEQGV